MPARPRIILATPVAEERETIAGWLIAEGYEPVLVVDALAAAVEIGGRPAAGLLVDYGLTLRADIHASWRARCPMTPPVVFGDPNPAAQTRTESLNAIFVERPLERVTTLCMVLMAILEGRPQRCSPRRPSSVNAVLNGAPSRIIDLSSEGLRLEVPREQRVPPPVFCLSVPTVGVTVNVRRMWTSTPSGPDRGVVLWCGGALTQNPAKATHGWRLLVDMTSASR